MQWKGKKTGTSLKANMKREKMQKNDSFEIFFCSSKIFLSNDFAQVGFTVMGGVCEILCFSFSIFYLFFFF